MAGYTRNDTGNNIADGNVINAADLDGEFDSIQTAFNETSGHTHDGTVGEGAPISVVGPAQDINVTITEVVPKTTNTMSLGTAALQFKDLYIDGTANIDSLVADTADINGGTIDGTTIGASTPAAITGTSITATGNITVAGTVDGRDVAADGTKLDTIETNADVTDTANVTAAGALMDSELSNITAVKAIDQGLATTDSPIFAGLTTTTADINGGTIDNTIIATSDITVGAGKTLDVSAGTLTLANDQISGDKIQGGTIGSTTITTLTGTTANVTNVNATTIDATNVEVTNIKAKDGTAAATLDNITGVITIPSSVLTTTDINGGTIDSAVIGGTTAAEGSFTNISASGNITVGGTVDGRDVATDGTKLDGIEALADVTDTANVTAAGALMDSEVTNLEAVKAFDPADYATAAQGILADTALQDGDTVASLTITSADINGGTIDNTTIATSNVTVGSGKTLDVSAGTLTLANDQISGDKIQGGTIGSTTITTLTGTTGNITNVNATTVDATNIEVTNVKAKDGTASATIADATGVMTIASSVLTTTDINGGTIDGVTIGASSAGAGTFTSVTGTGLDMNGAAVFNESGADVDFRIESDTNTHAFFLQGSDGYVGVGTSSPEGVLHTRQDQDGTTRVVIQNRQPTGAPVSELTFVTGGQNVSDNRYAYIQSAGVSASYLAFGTSNYDSPAERMRITSAGQAIIPGGVTLGTSAGAYNAANTLDDYEEGTWTPILSDGTTGATASTSYGHYTKIGNLVTAVILLQNINTTGLSSGSDIRITLPFSAATLPGQVVFNGACYLQSITLSGSPIVQMADGQSDCRIMTNNPSGSVKVSALASGAADITATIQYIAA